MKITRRQLRQAIKETLFLAEADTDGDGALGPDELRNLADKMEDKDDISNISLDPGEWGYENKDLEPTDEERVEEENKGKVWQLFWGIGAGMGIQMAEMTPGLEDLATEFEEFRVLVEEFVDLSDRFTAQGPTNMPLNSGDLYRAGENIKKAAMKLTSHPWQADKEVAHAATSWKNMFGKAMTWVRWSGTSNTRAFSASQDDYEALKDWVVV